MAGTGKSRSRWRQHRGRRRDGGASHTASCTQGDYTTAAEVGQAPLRWTVGQMADKRRTFVQTLADVCLNTCGTCAMIREEHLPMADNMKYYYMKLREDFFDSPEIAILECRQDGYLYSNILLKLYLRSLRDSGRLMLNGIIPYNVEMIAAITRHKQETVQNALELFQQLNLVEVLDSGAIYMANIQEFIGSSSTEADRKRLYRNRIENERRTGDGTNGGQMADICPDNVPTMSTRDRERTRDRDRVRDRERTGTAAKPPRSPRFSPPSVDEVRAYCRERGNKVDPERFVNFYASKGWKVGRDPMKDWKAAVRTWEQRDKDTKEQDKPYEYDPGDLSGSL